jgi:hypothetical protein
LATIRALAIFLSHEVPPHRLGAGRRQLAVDAGRARGVSVTLDLDLLDLRVLEHDRGDLIEERERHRQELVRAGLELDLVHDLDVRVGEDHPRRRRRRPIGADLERWKRILLDGHERTSRREREERAEDRRGGEAWHGDKGTRPRDPRHRASPDFGPRRQGPVDGFGGAAASSQP